MKLLNSTKIFIFGICVLGLGVCIEQSTNSLPTFIYCSSMLFLGLLEFRRLGQDKSFSESLLKW